MQEDLEVPQTGSARVRGCFKWHRLEQHELGHHAGFPPSKDTEAWVEFSSLTTSLNPTEAVIAQVPISL